MRTLQASNSKDSFGHENQRSKAALSIHDEVVNSLEKFEHSPKASNNKFVHDGFQRRSLGKPKLNEDSNGSSDRLAGSRPGHSRLYTQSVEPDDLALKKARLPSPRLVAQPSKSQLQGAYPAIAVEKLDDYKYKQTQ